MKSLKTKIFEGFYKNAGGMVRPTTKDELINEINKDEVYKDVAYFLLNDKLDFVPINIG